MRRPDGVTVIAIWHFIQGVLSLMGACVILAIPIPAVLLNVDDAAGLFWAMFGLGIGLVVTGGLGVFSLIIGWGLLELKEWARWIAIVLAVLSLPAFPIGTIIGGIIIWYLLQDEAREAFQSME